MEKINKILNGITLDFDLYHDLHFLLTNQKVHENSCLDSKILLLLEQPLKTYDYKQIKEGDELEDYTKIELSFIINNLLQERQFILKFFNILNVERMKLKEENLSLLKEILEVGENKMKNSGVNYLFNKCFLSIEIQKKYIQKLENTCENFDKIMKEKEQNLDDLKNENLILREKLIKSRENLRSYLINMPMQYNNEENLTSLPIQNENNNTKCSTTNENQDLQTSGSFEKMNFFGQLPNNKLQEWDKTSIVSQASRLGDSKKKMAAPYNKLASYSYIQENNPNNEKEKIAQKNMKIALNKTTTQIKTHRTTVDVKPSLNNKNNSVLKKNGNETPKILINSNDEKQLISTKSHFKDPIISTKEKNITHFSSQKNMSLVHDKNNAKENLKK